MRPMHLVTVGKLYCGQVVSVAPFGLFVEIDCADEMMLGLLPFDRTPLPEVARGYTKDQVWRWAGPAPAIEPDWLTWNGGVVLGLAQEIHAEGRHDLLPLLADALEDAGCADQALLAPCRQTTGPEQGCEVVSRLLGQGVRVG